MKSTKQRLRRRTGSRFFATFLSIVLIFALMPTMAAPVFADAESPLAYFDFDTAAVDNVFSSVDGTDAKATAQGASATYLTTQAKGADFDSDDKALYLNGSTAAARRTAFLRVTNLAGNPLLTGKEEITISYDANPNRTGTNWPVYLAPNANAQASPETYIGFLNSPSNTTIERYKSGRIGTAAVANTGAINEWNHVDVVLSAATTKIYVNGALQASVPALAAQSLSNILGDSSIFQIGRAQWGANGEFFNGLLDNIAVYDKELTAEQIAEQYAASDLAAIAKLNAAYDALTLGDTTNLIANLTLPLAGANGATITWATSDASVITANGVVAFANETKMATLTATIAVGGKTREKAFSVSVVAEDGKAEAVKSKIFVPYVLTADSKLPLEVRGYDIKWSSTPTGLINAEGRILPPSNGMTSATVGAAIEVGGETVSVSYNIRVLGQAKNLLTYTRNTTDALDASMHLALQDADGYTAMNYNEGILFPKADFTEPNNGTTKVLASPYAFRKADGSGFGVVAIRQNSGGARSTVEQESVLLFDTADLVGYKEVGFLQLKEGTTVNSPVCEYDGSSNSYAIWWTDNAGAVWRVTTTDFETVSAAVPATKPSPIGASSSSSIANAVPTTVLPLSGAEAKAVQDLVGLFQNTTVDGPADPIEVEVGKTLTSDAIGKALAHYTDGTTAQKPVDWNLGSVDFNKAGTYNITGQIVQEDFSPFPMISGRADPFVVKWKGYYYFIATNESGQASFEVRKSATLAGIRTAPDNTILRVSTSAPVQDMNSCLWAPEFHVIKGNLYIFFAGSPNGWNSGAARTMKLKVDGDPTVAADWEAPQKVLRKDGGEIQPLGLSIDMTYFEDNGKSYVCWSDRVTKAGTWSADLLIAEFDPDTLQLKSDPVTICRPDYSWDRNNSTNVVEGGNVLHRNGKIFLTFSGAAVDNSYCVGLLTAKENADLLDPASWTKTNYPLWTSANVPGEMGPGHNAYLTDDNGSVYNVYHAKPNGGTRSAGIRPVHFAADGRPIIDLVKDREILPANRQVTATVVVTDSSGPDLGESLLDMSFEENLNDVSPVNNQVTASKTVAYVTGIKTDTKAVNLTNSTYLNLGTSPKLNPQNLTLSFWVKPNATMSGEQMFVWNKANYNDDGWYISSESNSSPIAVSIGRATGQPYKVSVRTDRSGFFPANVWTHVVVTFDNTTKDVGIYRNGQKQVTNIDYAISGSAPGVIADSSVHKSFGWNGPNYSGAYANYALDELALYDKAAAAADVIGLYMEGNPDFDVLESIIKPDLNSLTVSSTVTSNLVLPVSGTRGTKITWTSSAQTVVDTLTTAGTGIVKRPEAGEEDAEVTLTATGTFAGKTFTRTFSVTVLAKTAAGGSEYIQDSGIESIELTDPYLINAANKEADYLLNFLDEKRFLYYFQTNAGLTPDAASGYGGWEAGTGNRFQGHFVGHYLSALSQMYASLKDPVLKQKALEKATYMVNAMKACQDAYALKDSANAGYLSPFSVTYLPSGASGLIVPFYNLHKVLAGLLDAYAYLPSDVSGKALGVASGFGTWVTNWKNAHPTANILGTEYGGMNEALYKLYSYTADPVHKKAAEAFDETTLFTQLAAGTDVLNGKHANTTIPKLTGALKRYTVMMENPEFYDGLTEAEKANLNMYRTAAENFWAIVLEHHTFANGGNSQSEHFHEPDVLGKYATMDSNTSETCNIYNMLKLTRELYKITGDKKYADYYEQAYINGIIASQNPETAMTMYFQPMGPGYSKIFGPPDNNFWCCQGTGIENFTKLGDSHFFTYKNRVYVNVYRSSTFSDKKHNAKVALTANFPNEDTATVKVTALGSGNVADDTKLYLRMPDWAKEDQAVLKVDGETVKLSDALITSGRDKGYIAVNATAGTEVSLKLPQKLIWHTTPDKPDLIAFQYGAYLLVAPQEGKIPVTQSHGAGILVRGADYDASVLGTIEISETQQKWLANLEENLVRVADKTTPTGTRVQFALDNVGQEAQALRFEPYMSQYEQRYGVYMYLAAPDSPESQNMILARKKELRDTEIASDVVAMFDNNNYEFSRGLKTGGNSNVGVYNGRQYRDATGTTSWFSYDLAYPKNAEKVYLRTTLTTADNNRTFDVFINDIKLTNIRVNNAAGTNVFYDLYLEIPKSSIDENKIKKDGDGAPVLDADGKEIPVLTVKYASDGSSSPVGGVYGVAITSSTTYDNNAMLKSLSFSGGTLSATFDPDMDQYRLDVPKGTEAVTMNVAPHVPSGLVYVNNILIDDTKPRIVNLKDLETIVLKAYAQDHTTSRTYTITLNEVNTAPADIFSLSLTVKLYDGRYAENSTTAKAWADFTKAINDGKAILAKPEDYTQAQVDAAKKAIEDTAKAVQANQVSTILLEIYIDIAREYLDNEDLYIKSAVTALKAALAAAEETLATRESQAKIDKAADDILAAIEKFDEKGDLVKVSTLVSFAGTLTQGDFTDESWAAVSKALEAADKVVLKADDASWQEADYVYDQLMNAILGLKDKVVLNFYALDSAIARGDNIAANAGKYVASSITGLNAALTAAKSVRSNATTQKAIDDATVALATVIAKARLKADLSGLQSLLTQAQFINLSLYTEESAGLVRSLSAKAAKLTGDDSQQTVDSVAGELSAAISALEKKPAGTVAATTPKSDGKVKSPAKTTTDKSASGGSKAATSKAATSKSGTKNSSKSSSASAATSGSKSGTSAATPAASGTSGTASSAATAQAGSGAQTDTGTANASAEQDNAAVAGDAAAADTKTIDKSSVPATQAAEQAEGGLPLYVWIALLLAVAVIGALGVFLAKRRHAKGSTEK